MKKIYKFSLFILILLIGYSLGKINNMNDVYEEKKIQSPKKNTNMLSMMLETDAGSGNYEMTTRDTWPTSGYKFNSELSKCENGGELSWDNENKRVLMSGNTSDKCYVYFDKEAPKISFTIDGTVYNAEEGMLWNEWVDSIYNTSGFNIEWYEFYGYNIIVNTSANAIALNVGDSEPLDASTAIISGHNYQLI